MLVHEGIYTVSEMCRVLEVTRQGYYQWKTRPVCAHTKRDQALKSKILAIWETSRHIYGSPRIFEAMKQQGVKTSKKRVERLMTELAIRGVSRNSAKRPDGKEKRVSRKDSPGDHVKRDFEAEGPNELWLADITYVRTYQGWLYLACVMDIWSRKIVGWSMGPHITAELADDALKMAIERRHPQAGCIHHTDHGSQYASLLLSKTMRAYNIVPSMGSVSSPWDNAPTESLMGTIKSECVHAKTFESREEASLEIFEYIECFYNRLRLHSALGYMSPDDYEKANWPQPLAA